MAGDGDRPPDDARVCIVATQAETFERCREGVYPCPRSYPRTNRDFEYMAFYRTAPTSAVTHLAPVTGRTVERRDGAGGEGATLDDTDWTTLLDPFSDADEAVVFHLGDLVALDRPVVNDTTGVRGAWYTTVGDLRTAGTLSALSAQSG